MSRPTPVDLVFGALADERFPALRDAVAAAGKDPRDRDAFVLVREVVTLLRDLRPDEGVGRAAEQLVAFVHAAFLFWLDGRPVLEVDRAALDRLVREPAALRADPGSGSTYYVQVPGRRVWGEPLADEPPEPLDGWFARATPGGLEVLAVFGLHPARPGFTAVGAGGPRPSLMGREDGSPVFAPRLEGGEAAGLWSVAGAGELLELAYRVEARLAGPPAPGRRPLVVD